jgi:hypothetical protein
MKKELIHQLALILLIIFSYFVGIANMQVLFILLTFLISAVLFATKKVFGFLYLFILYIDPLTLYTFNLPSEWPLILIIIFSIMNFNPFINLIAEDRIFKQLMFVSVLFLTFQIFGSFLSNVTMDPMVWLRDIGYILAFFISIPAYYFIVKSRVSIYYTISIVSIIVISLWLISYFSNYQILDIKHATRYGSSGIERVTFFGLNQITKFFIYLLPVVLLFETSKLKIATYFSLGLSSIFIIFLGLYRLEIFYTLGGLLLVLYYVSKKYKLMKTSFRIIVILLFAILVLSFVKPDIFDNLIFIYSKTVDYINNQNSEASADIRRYIELPQLINLILTNPLLGNGFFSLTFEKLNSWAYVDIPLLGNIAAYGLLGVSLYFLKFVIIIKRYNSFTYIWNNSYRLSNTVFKNEILLIIVLFAYFISMISFRLFYITYELISATSNAEFGFFIGVFFGLIRIIEDNRIIEDKVYLASNQ